MGLPIRAFLEELKKLAGVTTRTIGVEEAEKLLKQIDSQIKSVDDAIKSLPVTKSPEGYLKLGDEHAGVVHQIMKEGDLEALIRIAKRPDIPVTSADKAAFKATVADTPEKAFRDMDDVSKVNKRTHADIDVTPENIDKLSPAGKTKLAKVQDTLTKYFKLGTTITLTVGVVYVTVDAIAKATEARKGCYMLTSINGKTSSCKVMRLSCIGSREGNECTQPPSDNIYNATISLMYIATLADTNPIKVKLCKAIGTIKPAELKDKLDDVITNSYEKAANFIYEMSGADKRVPNPCEISNPKVEKGIVPPCRMCSPTANPTSTQFVDPALYGDNITFRCIINPSILDTITDIIISTGRDLLENVGGFASDKLKPLLIGVGVILALVVVIIFFLKNRGKSNADVSTQSSEKRPLLQEERRRDINNNSEGNKRIKISNDVYD